MMCDNAVYERFTYSHVQYVCMFKAHLGHYFHFNYCSLFGRHPIQNWRETISLIELKASHYIGIYETCN